MFLRRTTYVHDSDVLNESLGEEANRSELYRLAGAGSHLSMRRGNICQCRSFKLVVAVDVVIVITATIQEAGMRLVLSTETKVLSSAGLQARA